LIFHAQLLNYSTEVVYSNPKWPHRNVPFAAAKKSAAGIAELHSGAKFSLDTTFCAIIATLSFEALPFPERFRRDQGQRSRRYARRKTDCLFFVLSLKKIIKDVYRFGCFLLIAGALFIGGRETGGQQISSLTSKSQQSFLDRVHQGDLIDIHVVGHLEFDWRGGLTPEGFLDGFDKIATEVFAQCRTEKEIAADIDKALLKTVRNPKTEVRVLDRSKRPFAIIDGAIKTPSRLQLKRPVYLNEIIIASGGFTDRTSGDIIISRPRGLSCIETKPEATGDRVPTRFDIRISDLLAGKADANPAVVGGDLIVILEASPVYVIGAVAVQGRMDYRPQLTVSRAVASAGDVLKDAVLRQVNIFRRERGTASIIPVDLEKIRSNESNDIPLRPFDIIDVPFKGRPPRRLPPVLEDELSNPETRSKLPLKIIE